MSRYWDLLKVTYKGSIDREDIKKSIEPTIKIYVENILFCFSWANCVFNLIFNYNFKTHQNSIKTHNLAWFDNTKTHRPYNLQLNTSWIYSLIQWADLKINCHVPFYIGFIQKSFGLLLPFWIFFRNFAPLYSSSDLHSFLCSYSKRYKKYISQLDGWIRKRLFLFIMSEVQEVEMHLYFKTNLQNHNLDHHM